MYGFKLIGYIIGLFIVGGLLMFIGVDMMGPFGGSPILGGILILIGVLIIYAGLAGTMYKVIADGVEKGNRAAEQPVQQHQPRGGAAQQPQGQPRQ